MKYHIENTDELLSLASLSRESRILDCGARDGQSNVSDMIDISPLNSCVKKADFLNLPFDDNTFDGVLSQCSFYISGNVEKAISEAHRVLKPGGKLIYSDIFFERPSFPGFTLDYEKDLTDQWKQYYIERLWSDEPIPDCEIPNGKGKVHYSVFILTKEL